MFCCPLQLGHLQIVVQSQEVMGMTWTDSIHGRLEKFFQEGVAFYLPGTWKQYQLALNLNYKKDTD